MNMKDDDMWEGEDEKTKKDFYENRKRRKKIVLQSPEYFRNYPRSWFPKKWEKYEKEQNKLSSLSDD